MSIEIMNKVWKNSQASGRQRLVLLAIADHQGEIGAWPSIETLAKMVKASERSVQRDIQALATLGELIIEHRAAPTNGPYKANRYWVNIPEVTKTVPEVTNGASEVTESASEVTAGGVLTLNRTLNRNTTKPNPDGFDEFWEIYPRKVGKPAAVRAWKTATKKKSTKDLIEALKQYVANELPSEVRFIPYPATWLNDERFETVKPKPETEWKFGVHIK